MLATLCDVLKTAQERKIAIGSFNVISFETMRAMGKTVFILMKSKREFCYS